MIKTSKLILYYFLISLLLGIIVNKVIKYQPRFKVNQCGKDSIQKYTRKVKSIDTFIYRYCIFKNEKCEGNFNMRLKDFDRLMIKTKCPEAK